MNKHSIDRLLSFTGEKHYLLTAEKYLRHDKGKQVWLFRCDCGGEKITTKDKVTSGQAKSCGCIAVGRGHYQECAEFHPTMDKEFNFAF